MSLVVIIFSFEDLTGSTSTEGDPGGVIVQRNSVRPSRPVSVFVHTRMYTGDLDLLQQGQFIADTTGQ